MYEVQAHPAGARLAALQTGNRMMGGWLATLTGRDGWYYHAPSAVWYEGDFTQQDEHVARNGTAVVLP
jgi:hypothetical protein